jgi:hypothetical protein
MSYLTVISLARAKNYLRIDADLTDDDAEITSMINASLRYVENRTNHIVYAREKVYNGSCQVKVYDYPINSIITDPAPFVCYFSTFAIFPDVKTVTLNVGYLTPDLVPDELIQAALQMIKVWYYESEKQVNSTLIPESVKEALDVYRRFL